MEEKLRFVFGHEQGHRLMKELCQRNEIARETGYVWILPPVQHRMDRVNRSCTPWQRYGKVRIEDMNSDSCFAHMPTPVPVLDRRKFRAAWTEFQ
jgi:hypothetical protein